MTRPTGSTPALRHTTTGVIFGRRKRHEVEQDRQKLAHSQQENAELRGEVDALQAFVVNHIGKPYTADECGRVLHVHPA